MAMRSASEIKALTFDHYGTLFNKEAIADLIDQAVPGRGVELARAWFRTTQEYCWLNGMMGRHQTWADLTRTALDYVFKSAGLSLDPALAKTLIDADVGLPPHPDVPAALQAVVADREETNRRQHALVARIRERVAATVPDVEVVGDPDRRLPHLVTFSCLYVDGEALVSELDRHGLGVSSGSACTASTHTPSHVLEAMGVLTHGNVRVSVSTDATAAQLDAFAEAVAESVAALRAEVGL